MSDWNNAWHPINVSRINVGSFRTTYKAETKEGVGVFGPGTSAFFNSRSS